MSSIYHPYIFSIEYIILIGVGTTQRRYRGSPPNFTETEGTIYFFPRGPTVDGRLKPDVTAPGSSISSACSESDNSYCELSGNNAASSHVAGTAALLVRRNPGLTFDHIKSLLQDNADRNLDEKDPWCFGDENSTVYPNQAYGRINARRALTALIGGPN